MKIGFTALDLREGKIKYHDADLLALAEKDKPKKVSPFFAEFLRDEFTQSDAIVLPAENLLDLLILDMEKIEARLMRLEEVEEKELMEKCLAHLEQEIPLCDAEWNDSEKKALHAFAPHSFKPVVLWHGEPEANAIISAVLKKSQCMFFYTSGPKESHAWLVKQNSSILTCAAKIHSDLARGFIKGDVVSFEDYMNCHNFNECKSKGLAKLTDRNYIVQPREIIEIRFNA